FTKHIEFTYKVFLIPKCIFLDFSIFNNNI
ncbi:MAG: hypothetical protein QG598_1430, partial [Bacillota bacterium]|nr:hypothetical protein [Bacillota bacterium]